MTADEEKAFFLRERDELVADRLFYAAAVDDDSSRFEQIGVFSYIFYRIVRVEGYDHDIALREQLFVQRLFYGIDQHGFFNDLIRSVVSIYLSLIHISSWQPMRCSRRR